MCAAGPPGGERAACPHPAHTACPVWALAELGLRAHSGCLELGTQTRWATTTGRARSPRDAWSLVLLALCCLTLNMHKLVPPALGCCLRGRAPAPRTPRRACGGARRWPPRAACWTSCRTSPTWPPRWALTSALPGPRGPRCWLSQLQCGPMQQLQCTFGCLSRSAGPLQQSQCGPIAAAAVRAHCSSCGGWGCNALGPTARL